MDGFVRKSRVTKDTGMMPVSVMSKNDARWAARDKRCKSECKNNAMLEELQIR